MRSYSLTELAKAAGVSGRTVRYYIQRGLLRAPEFRGPDTQYDESHLLTLQAIRTLQAAYWPLEVIGPSLQAKSTEQLRSIAAGKVPTAAVVSPQPAAAAANLPRVTTSSARGPVDIDEASRGTRFILADGLELWLDDAASPSVRKLADAVRAFASEQPPARKGGHDER
jgi:Ca-activated chloride channel family protein